MAIKNHHHGNHRCTLPKAQTGAVLLALMLIVIIGSSYFLVTKLNTNLALTQQSRETGIALSSAKEALIGYAITFPDHDTSGVVDGPGYLPCPDLDGTDDDNRAASNCSAGGDTTIGRLPNQTLRLEELRDASGQRLWYALSENFRFGTWKTIPLNSESPSSAELSINGTGDIAAIIFAPGEPFDNQDRDIDVNDVTNYLEDDNANLDTSFVTNANVDFNDRLIVITRQELMEAVEKRVLGEARMILTNYFNDQGAYPWLTPFADPKTVSKRLVGTHDGSDGDAALIDTTVDFTKWGVSAGDVIWNITDGSIGQVAAGGVAANALTLTASGLTFGEQNDFDIDEEYYVEVSALVTALSGTATTGSSGFTLVESGQNFTALDVSEGDIVDNVTVPTNISSGVIDSVAATTITVKSLKFPDSTDDSFSVGDLYQIRLNTGVATADTDANGLTLEDTNIDFSVKGIQAGDLIKNITDGSYGRIINPITTNQLTVGELRFGVSNTFSNNDYYVLPRLNAKTNNREGLLSFHEQGEIFHTGFSIDWQARESDGSVVDSTEPANSGKPRYANDGAGIEEWAESSGSNNSGTIAVSESDGQCRWISEAVAECTGISIDSSFLSGSPTSVTASSFTNTAQNFENAGVDTGDKIENISDNKFGLVLSAASTTVNFVDIDDGNPAFTIDANDEYRISVATRSIRHKADTATQPGNHRVYDTQANDEGQWNNIEVGDIVENDDSDGVGVITAKGISAGVYWFDYTPLQGGADDHIDNDPRQWYNIYFDYVARREYEFNVKINGSSQEYPSNETHVRDVCLGYGADCTSAASNTTLPGDSVTAMLTIRDYDAADNEVGNATVTVPLAGSQGNVKIAGINYMLLAENVDIPAWFIENKWHQLIYIAYSAGDSPSGGAMCTVAGANCLTLTGGGGPNNNKRALVISAGEPLATLDRTSGNMTDYYESENNDQLTDIDDDNFQTGDIINTFNDQVRILDTSP